MKRIIVVTILLFLPLFLFSQETLTGMIMDKNNPKNNPKTQSCSPSARRPAPRKNILGRFVATVKVATVIAAAAMRTVCPKMLAARTV